MLQFHYIFNCRDFTGTEDRRAPEQTKRDIPTLQTVSIQYLATFRRVSL